MREQAPKRRGSQFRQRREKAEQYGGAESYDYEGPRFPKNRHYADKGGHARRGEHHHPKRKG